MSETIIVSAFLAGLVSSCSMPLGSITSLLWNPKNRALAFLIAFGAGALLAALVIDLVGSAREKGHLVELVIGSLIGSLFFTAVNQWVNSSGGFLRKPSTMLVHLSQKQTRQFEQSLSQLRRLDLFRDLPPEESQYLARHLLLVEYPPHTIIYQSDDPSESLYIIRKGEVQLFDSLSPDQPHTTLKANDTFGSMAFVTGSPHKTMAQTTRSTQLAILPKPDFEQLLQMSPTLVETTEHFLQAEQVANYLQKRQGLTLIQVKDWVKKASASLRKQRLIPDAVCIDHHIDEFLQLARQIRRFPVFEHLPLDDLEEVAERLVYRHFEDGHVFFQTKEAANRLYIVHQGEVELIDATSPGHQPLIVSTQDAFGALGFVTGAPHSVTAVAKTDATAWVLRKQDFEEMLHQSKSLENGLRDFLSQEAIAAYLEQKQHFDSQKASAWVHKALHNMNAGQLIPSATSVADTIEEHGSAPVSIWLGLLMDGIPEALTIGAHIVVAPISPSLITGLFISNYPEALSSSTGMKHQGFSVPRILMMWTSIMLITGILAAIGSILFANVPESFISLLESMAAGAMLTVISETMLPEAYAKGGPIAGISTLLGFLVIILINAHG